MKKQEVRVLEWNCTATVIEDLERKKVMMEVATPLRNCPICKERYPHVVRALTRKNVKCKWEYPAGKRTYIALDHPGAQANLPAYLGRMLDLTVSEA